MKLTADQQREPTLWVVPASTLTDFERYCTCCERQLLTKARFLELDQRTQTYHDIGDVPNDKSQGWFPFGMTCARKLVSAEMKRRGVK